jgi:hypothetical protein
VMNQHERGRNCLSGGRSGSGCLFALLLGGSGSLLLLGGGGVGTLSLVAVRRCPEGKVVTEELHNESAVAVRLLGERVELSNGIVESLLGQVASAVGRVQDLVVEDREVQGQTQADGVGRGELGLSNVGGRLWIRSMSVLQVNHVVASYLVGLVCGGSGNLALLAGSELGEVTVVVTLPAWLSVLCGGGEWSSWAGLGSTHILW